MLTCHCLLIGSGHIWILNCVSPSYFVENRKRTFASSLKCPGGNICHFWKRLENAGPEIEGKMCRNEAEKTRHKTFLTSNNKSRQTFESSITNRYSKGTHEVGLSTKIFIKRCHKALNNVAYSRALNLDTIYIPQSVVRGCQGSRSR